MSVSSESTSATNEPFRDSTTPLSPRLIEHHPLSVCRSARFVTQANGVSKPPPASTLAPEKNSASPTSSHCATPVYENQHLSSSTYHNPFFYEFPESCHEASVSNFLPGNPAIDSSSHLVKQEFVSCPSPLRNPVSLSFTENSAVFSLKQKGEFEAGFSSNVVDYSICPTDSLSDAKSSPSDIAQPHLNPNGAILFTSSIHPDVFPPPVFPIHSVSQSPLPLTSRCLSTQQLPNNHSFAPSHPLTGTFAFNEVQLSLANPISTEDVMKCVNSGGTTIGNNFRPLLNLNSSSTVCVPLGTSPRSKNRRYSYPDEPDSTGNVSKPSLIVSYPLSSNGCQIQEGLTLDCFRSFTGNLPLPELTVLPSNGSRSTSVHFRDALNAVEKLPSINGEVPLPGFNSPESAFYQYQHRMEGQRCQVCGELAAGFHHGAYVCEACKKFFMRHSLTDTKPTNVCPTGGNCVVAKGSRGKCQICRYRKCLMVGMKMKDPESQPDVDISHIPCRVCGGRSSGFHFGALTCEGCKGFFRRTEGSASSLVCVGGQNACTITPRSRNACKSCRFRRCIAAGMSKKGSRIGRQPNAVKFHCAIEIRQLRSLRSNYPTPMDNQGDSLSSTLYGGFASVNNPGGLRLDTPGSASLHNRSDADSPDNLTPTYNPKRESDDASGVWINEQKPPLSLLLLLPRPSDPINTSATCGGRYLTSDANFPRYTGAVRERSDSDVTVTDSYISGENRPSLNGRTPVVETVAHSFSDGEDVTSISPAAELLQINRSSCQSTFEDGTTLASPLGNFAPDRNGVNGSMENGQPSTASLIADLANRLGQQGHRLGDDETDTEAWIHETPPSDEAIARFTEGMRTATEFLRLPNTYFKTRFRMSAIPINIRDDIVQVWNHMMNHFHMHAQQIVQFAKLVPGFNQLGITARSSLVRGAMYPVVLLLLSRDYQADTDQYNYFDFTLEERDVILHHFPSFSRITEHLRMTGLLLHHLHLTFPELSLSSAVEILRSYHSLDEPTRSSTKQLFLLANHSLRACMTRRADTCGDMTLDQGHRWTQLMALSKMIQAMNGEHRDILSALKDSRFDLHFPELYVEMFQLADSASALFSASAQAATLACSSTIQSLAPLTLSLGASTQPTAPTNSSSSSSSGKESGLMATHGDRWDAGRFALAVPAAMSVITSDSITSVTRDLQQQSVPRFVDPVPRTPIAPSTAPQQEMSPSKFLFATQHQFS